MMYHQLYSTINHFYLLLILYGGGAYFTYFTWCWVSRGNVVEKKYQAAEKNRYTQVKYKFL